MEASDLRDQNSCSTAHRPCTAIHRYSILSTLYAFQSDEIGVVRRTAARTGPPATGTAHRHRGAPYSVG
jgi:hypothetical protein